MLRGLKPPVIEQAIKTCRAASDAWIEATEARQALEWARAASQVWLDPLRDRAEALTEHAVCLTLEAYARAEEAEGARGRLRSSWRGLGAAAIDA